MSDFINFFQNKKLLIGGLIILLIIIVGLLLFTGKNNKSKWEEAGSLTGNITILLNEKTSSPFSLLSLQVRNLQNLDAATSAVFTQENGNTTTIPVIIVSSEQIDVPIPPIINDDGNFGYGNVSLKIIQAQRLEDDEIVMESSNEIFNITILPMPEIDSRLVKGEISASFIAAAIDSLDTKLETAAQNTELYRTIQENRAALEDLLQKINLIIKNPQTTINLATKDGTVVVNAEDLDVLDKIFLAILTEYEKGGGFSSKNIIPSAYAKVCQDAQTEDPALVGILKGANACNYEQSVRDRAQQAGNTLPRAARLAWAPALILSGRGVSALTVGAPLMTRVAWSAAFSISVDFLISGRTNLTNISLAIGSATLDKTIFRGVPVMAISIPTARFLLQLYQNYSGALPTTTVILPAMNSKTIQFVEAEKNKIKVTILPIPLEQGMSVAKDDVTPIKKPTQPKVCNPDCLMLCTKKIPGTFGTNTVKTDPQCLANCQAEYEQCLQSQ